MKKITDPTLVCLKCNKPIGEHRVYTQADIDASNGATYQFPVNGYLAPLHPSLIGQWKGHDPLLKNFGYIEPDLTYSDCR